MVRVVVLGTADVEVELLGRGVDRAGGAFGGLELHLERFAVAHSLRHHEVDLVVAVQLFAVQRGAAVAPAGDVQQALRPVRVAAASVAVFEQVGRDAAVLARRELVEAIEFDDVLPFRKLQLGPEGPRVRDLVDVDQDLAADRRHVAGVVAHVVPGRLVVQPADLVHVGTHDDEATVVQLVLLRLVEAHAGARLVAGGDWRRLRFGLGGPVADAYGTAGQQQKHGQRQRHARSVHADPLLSVCVPL